MAVKSPNFAMSVISDTLAITTVTVMAVSTTIQALLAAAGVTINAACKRITLRPASDISCAVGAAAVSGTNVLNGGYSHELLCKSTTDLRLIAAGNVVCMVVQEG